MTRYGDHHQSLTPLSPPKSPPRTVHSTATPHRAPSELLQSARSHFKYPRTPLTGSLSRHYRNPEKQPQRSEQPQLQSPVSPSAAGVKANPILVPDLDDFPADDYEQDDVLDTKSSIIQENQSVGSNTSVLRALLERQSTATIRGSEVPATVTSSRPVENDSDPSQTSTHKTVNGEPLSQKIEEVISYDDLTEQERIEVDRIARLRMPESSPNINQRLLDVLRHTNLIIDHDDAGTMQLCLSRMYQHKSFFNAVQRRFNERAAELPSLLSKQRRAFRLDFSGNDFDLQEELKHYSIERRWSKTYEKFLVWLREHSQFIDSAFDLRVRLSTVEGPDELED